MISFFPLHSFEYLAVQLQSFGWHSGYITYEVSPKKTICDESKPITMYHLHMEI